MTLLEDMLSGNELENSKKGRVVYLDAEDIVPNENNIFNTEEIESLAENIKDEGLLQPLIVWKNKNENVLHTGHRRFKAIQYLISNNQTYSYFGKDITGTVPVIYIDSVAKDELEMQISMIRSNSYRHLTDTEKNNLIDITEEYVKQLELKGQKPQGRTREIIAEITGITLNYIQNYLSKKNKVEVLTEGGKDKQPKKEDKIKKFIKKLDKLTAEICELEFDEVSADDHDRIQDAIDDLKGGLDHLIY